MISAAAVIVLGFFIGLVSGATGVGGGTLLAPFLIYVLKIDPFVSMGTDVFVSAITKTVSSVIHKRANNVEIGTSNIRRDRRRPGHPAAGVLEMARRYALCRDDAALRNRRCPVRLRYCNRV